MTNPTHPAAPGPDDLLGTVLAAAEQVFGRSPGPDDGFFTLGGDSIAAVELVTALEEELATDIDTALVFRADTFAELALLLAQTSADTGPAAHRAPGDSPDGRTAARPDLTGEVAK
ncbi:acyl carrier protein [Streptomyces sp. NPDC058683]|uniref:acyl carrier protein n=1 Tax=Streptomyces sp. NPDC058683 TaxID=3346597 RepID=UPI003658046C